MRALPQLALVFPRLLVRVTPRRLRRPLLILIFLAGVLGAAYGLWIRDLGAFRVETVAVTGATSRDAAKLRAALTAAAKGMTTLHVRKDTLREVAAGHSAVAGLDVSSDLPHGLHIRVTEHRAVAVVQDARGGRVPVAPDGTLLRTVRGAEDLPVVPARPASDGARVGPGEGQEAVRIAAAAPGPLLAGVERVGRRPGAGFVAVLRDGPDLIFGDAGALRAKWAAAAAVLADASTASAAYVDLRLPDRPAVGGLPQEADPDPSQGEAEPGVIVPTPAAPEAGAQTPPAPGTIPAEPTGPAPGAAGASPGPDPSAAPPPDPQP